MELSIDSSDRENEVISGFYYYKNKGKENFIPLIGSCSHGYSSGSVATLFLETMSSSENFEVQDVGSLWGKGRITGIWTLYDGWNQETVKNELKLELKNKSL